MSSQRQRLEDLRIIINLCFGLINETDMKEVANKTRLSVATLYRLQSDKLTLNVRWGTVQALADAAGLVIKTSGTKHKLSLKGSGKS